MKGEKNKTGGGRVERKNDKMKANELSEGVGVREGRRSDGGRSKREQHGKGIINE